MEGPDSLADALGAIQSNKVEQASAKVITVLMFLLIFMG